LTPRTRTIGYRSVTSSISKVHGRSASGAPRSTPMTRPGEIKTWTCRLKSRRHRHNEAPVGARCPLAVGGLLRKNRPSDSRRLTFKSVRVSPTRGRLRIVGDITTQRHNTKVAFDRPLSTWRIRAPWGNDRRGSRQRRRSTRGDFGMTSTSASKPEGLVGDRVAYRSSRAEKPAVLAVVYLSLFLFVFLLFSRLLPHFFPSFLFPLFFFFFLLFVIFTHVKRKRGRSRGRATTITTP